MEIAHELSDIAGAVGQAAQIHHRLRTVGDGLEIEGVPSEPAGKFGDRCGALRAGMFCCRRERDCCRPEQCRPQEEGPPPQFLLLSLFALRSEISSPAGILGRGADPTRALGQGIAKCVLLPNKSALPSTLLQVVRLADPSYLIEVDAIAILPPAT